MLFHNFFLREILSEKTQFTLIGLEFSKLAFTLNFVKQASVLLQFLNNMIGLLDSIVLLLSISIFQLLKVSTNFLIVILQHVTSSSLLWQRHLPFAHVELFMRIFIKLLVLVPIELICEGQTNALHLPREVIRIISFQVLMSSKDIEIVLHLVSASSLKVVNLLDNFFLLLHGPC